MPYCFKESGLVLGIFLILFSGFITKKTCMFLIKAAIMSRRRSYELLAFQVFGVTGKLLMELCMILFLIGICISFHVVMGDLAPSIVAKYMIIENSPSLRCILLVGMMLLVILPLCLLRNLESLASMSACSICFYIFLTCIMSYFALPNLLDGSWIHKAELFQFNNAFRAFPIMTLALSCQSNVFEIYDSIPDPDVVRMKSVVSQAVNICCGLYIGVGFLGYVAFVDRDVGGNIIMSFPVSHLTDGITMFFVFSLAISFPLILFPCRTSIHSLIYKRNAQLSYDLVGNYMPESRFKIITFTVLTSSLIVGILLPNIEFVLGLLGSTMGVIIALILPAVFYVKVYTKMSLDRLLAQGFFLLGILLMVMGTYLHLSGLQNTKDNSAIAPSVRHPHEDEAKFVAPGIVVKDLAPLPLDNHPQVEDKATGRKEPAIPEPPDDPPQDLLKKEPSLVMISDKETQKQPPKETKDGSALDVNRDSVTNQKKVPVVVSGSGYASDVKPAEQEDPSKVVKKYIKEEDLHPDAIQKEEKENAEEERGVQTKENIERKQEQILKQMEHQQNEQKKLIEEQKKILQQLKDQQILEIEGANAVNEGGGVAIPNGVAPPAQVSNSEQPQQPVQQQHLQPFQSQPQQPVQQQPLQPVQPQPLPSVQQQPQQPVQQQPLQQIQQLPLQSLQQQPQQPIQQQSQQPIQQQPLHSFQQQPQQLVQQQPQQLVQQQPQQLVQQPPQQLVQQRPQQPVQQQPQQLIQQQSQQLVQQRPQQPVQQQPLQSDQQQPMQPAQSQPLQSAQQQPIQPAQQQPIQPAQQQPIQPAQQQPIQPAQQQPIQPAQQQPIQPAQQQPMQQAQQQKIQSDPQQPLHSLEQQSLLSIQRQPEHSISQQPYLPIQQQPHQLAPNQQLQQPLSQQALQGFPHSSPLQLQNLSVRPQEAHRVKSSDSNPAPDPGANSPSPDINRSLSRNGLSESKPNPDLPHLPLKEFNVVENKLEPQEFKQPTPSPEGSINSKGVAKIPLLPVQVKHDEERRKRDLVSVSNDLWRAAPNLEGDRVKIRPPTHLSAPNEDILRKEVHLDEGDAIRVDALYDTRHLLSFGYKTRRRKRRHEQFPEYWDEM